MTKKLTVSIWRGKSDGRYQSYDVELRQNQTVLDIVTEVQRQHEPSLAYRYACRVGVCGSCAMTVNGIPRWTCRTHVNQAMAGQNNSSLTIGPLRNLPVIKDLVVDLKPFFEKWQSSGGVFRGGNTRHDPVAKISSDSSGRKTIDAGIECINCAVCYSACDVVGWDNSYAGPAVLNRIWTLVNDQRQLDRRAVFNKAFADGGCGSCHSQGNCTRHCPVQISPSESIAALKRSAFFGLPKINDSNDNSIDDSNDNSIDDSNEPGVSS